MKKLLLYLVLLLPFLAMGQQHFEAGLFGGFANYQGDLVAPQIEFSETKFSYGAFMRYHLSEKFKLKVNGYLGFITGSDENDDGSLRSRGWSFESNLLEVAATGEYHPLGRVRYGETGIFQRQLSPYGFVGVGMVHFDPEVMVSKAEDDGLFPEQDFSPTSFTVPFGLGLRADLLESLSLGFEGGWRVTFNDYIDGVSANGNSDKNDLYIFLGATISYFFPSQEEASPF